MKTKSLLLLLFVLTFTFNLRGQVTIGSGENPEKAALLDIKTKNGGEGLTSSDTGGVLLPRVELNNVNEFNIFTGVKTTDPDYELQKKRHKGLAVYNIKSDYNSNLEEGIYVWNGVKWEKPIYKRVNFFYMPSIKIDTSTTGDKTPIDLYQAYKDQFLSPKVKSLNAPTWIPFFVNRNELYYYITDFDESVFDKNKLAIDSDGIMNYSILNPTTDGSSYINIVFVVK